MIEIIYWTFFNLNFVEKKIIINNAKNMLIIIIENFLIFFAIFNFVLLEKIFLFCNFIKL